MEASSKVLATETLVVLQSGRTRFVFFMFGATTVAITTTSLMTLPVVLNVVTTYYDICLRYFIILIGKFVLENFMLIYSHQPQPINYILCQHRLFLIKSLLLN